MLSLTMQCGVQMVLQEVPKYTAFIILQAQPHVSGECPHNITKNQHDLYLAWLLLKFPWVGSYKQAHVSSIIMIWQRMASPLSAK